MNRLFIKIVVFSLLCVGTMTCQAMATQTGTAQALLDDIETQIHDQQKKIERLKEGIEDHKSRFSNTRKKEVSLLTELDNLNRRLQEEKNKLAGLKKDLAKQENQIKEKTKELGQAFIEKETVKSHVQKRLNAYYRMGPVGMMNVIFSTSSLPDLINMREYFQHLIQHDQQVIDDYRAKIDQLNQAKQALTQEKEQLLVVIASVDEQKKRLTATRQERMALLDRVKTEKRLYQMALLEIQEAAEHLNITLKKLEKEHAIQLSKVEREEMDLLSSPKKRRPGRQNGFALQKGLLDPPVMGTVTTYFGKNTKGRFGISTYANGIDIKTEPGTEIRAVYDGRVVYVGILRGYGNLIIVDHGNQYYSLVSRASALFKKEGDFVQRGEVIGTMSEQEGLLSEGLHFEIRHGTEPENPLHWINNEKLKVKAARITN